MKTREAWIDEAMEFVGNWKAVTDEPITFDVVFREVKDGWSDDVNYDGTPEEYAKELLDYIEDIEEE